MLGNYKAKHSVTPRRQVDSLVYLIPSGAFMYFFCFSWPPCSCCHLSSKYKLFPAACGGKEGLSIPLVERSPGVLLLWAKPLSFCLRAIDARCQRGCLSFVFLSGAGRRGRGRGGEDRGGTGLRKQRENTSFQETWLLLLRIWHLDPNATFWFAQDACEELDSSWWGRSETRQGYVKDSQPAGEWLSGIISWFESWALCH